MIILYSKDKKEIEKKFENSHSKEMKGLQKQEQIETKCESVVLPIFNDYEELLKKQGCTVVREDKYHLTVTRGNVSFYIKCDVFADRIEIRYLFEGGGLEPIHSFTTDKITKDAITVVFKKFTDYILEWS